MTSYYGQPYNVNEYNENKENKENKEKVSAVSYTSLYMITHLIISLFAIYLSWRCNNGFDLASFSAAFFCPYLYIIFALATRGGCGIFDSNCLVEPIRMISR